MQIDQEKIEAAIVREAADNIIHDDAIYERVKRDIDARVEKLFSDRVEKAITDKIDGMVLAGFDAPYTKRDGFGRPLGEPTTISAELERAIQGYWTSRVDKQGKPTDSSYSSTTRAEWLMLQICADDFQKEVKQHVINVAGHLKDGFRLQLNETVNTLLSEMFKVRSLDDQARDRRDNSIIQPKAGPVT